MTSRILVTGGSGLLGLNWAATMRHGSQVVLGVHERAITLAGTTAHKVSLESAADVGKALDEIRPTHVVHAAGLTNVDACENAPDLAMRVNVALAENVAAACRQRDIPLAHISTDHVFAGDLSYASEETPPEPINVYGRSKAEAELRVMDAHPGALVIRTNFYGWGSSYRQSFSDWIIGALERKEKITLFEDVYYTPILATQLVRIVHGLFDNSAQGIFHVVGDERISKYEFGLRLAAIFGLDSSNVLSGSITSARSLIQRPNDMSLSNSKASKLLGVTIGGVTEHLMALHQQQPNISQELKTL